MRSPVVRRGLWAVAAVALCGACGSIDGGDADAAAEQDGSGRADGASADGPEAACLACTDVQHCEEDVCVCDAVMLDQTGAQDMESCDIDVSMLTFDAWPGIEIVAGGCASFVDTCYLGLSLQGPAGTEAPYSFSNTCGESDSGTAQAMGAYASAGTPCAGTTTFCLAPAVSGTFEIFCD